MTQYSVVLNDTGTTISFQADELAAHPEGFFALLKYVQDPTDESKIVKEPVFVSAPNQVKAIFRADSLVPAPSAKTE